VTPIFDLRQLGARSPGTCQVHRRSMAGPSRVHADSDPARLQPDAPRAGRAHCIAEQGAKPAHSGEPLIGNTLWASPPPDPGSAATRCAADGSCLCVGQDEAIKDLPEGLQTRQQSSARPAQPGGQAVRRTAGPSRTLSAICPCTAGSSRTRMDTAGHQWAQSSRT
jgi:hypothetical protein